MILSELIEEYISGDWGNEEINDDTPNEVFCIRGADFVPILCVDYTKIPTRYISDTSYKNKQLKVGDIIIEKSGGSPTQSTGRVILVTEELLREKQHIVCSNFCEAFRVKKEWNPFYVFTYLQFLYNEGVFFNFEGKTSGLKNLQMEQAFNSIDIPEQESDISLLASIDKKLALNHKINIELEALAKEIYDYWFVQFDFPNEEGKPYKSSGGKMVWNEKLKREIPEAWSDCVLSHYIGRITNGLNPRKNFVLGTGDNFYVTIRSLTGTDIDWDNCDRCDDEALAKINNRSQLEVGDVIFSAIGTIGRTYFIQEQPTNWNISETSFTLRAKENVDPYFFYALLRSEEIQKNADKNAMGSTLRCLVMDAFSNILTVKIDPNIIKCFAERVTPLYKKIYKINKENRKLKCYKDYLLPLLMNGQIISKD